MTTRVDAPTSAGLHTQSTEVARLYQEGIVAGVLGAAVIALWFLILDSFAGRPFYTPTVLGTALFRHGVGLDRPEMVETSFDMVVVFTWVHLLVFAVLGGVASHLLALAERRPNLGFGVVLLFVIFEFGFVTLCMVFAEDVLHALAWEKVLIGNTLAAAAMAAYLWRRHPHLYIAP